MPPPVTKLAACPFSPHLTLALVLRYDVAFIFELLWRNRKLSSGAPEEGLNIWLPETIVFRHSHPTGW